LCRLTCVQLADMQIASAAYLKRAGYDDRDTFYHLYEKFKCMLVPDNLYKSAGWFDRARLWRVIFLANEEGWFDPSQGLAFSLQAVCASPAEDDGSGRIMTRLKAITGARTRAAGMRCTPGTHLERCMSGACDTGSL
jgi:hypothetical protein